MEESSLIINFSLSGDDDDPETKVKIKQEEWAPYSGIITKTNMVKYLISLIYGDDEEDYEDYVSCNMDGTSYVAAIYVYPYEADLNYSLQTSYGTLSERAIEEEEFEETISVSLDDEVSASYPITEIISAEWDGTVYDSDGSVTEGPEITFDGLTFIFSKEIYGTLKVTYKVTKHSYFITVDKRENTTENYYSSTVFAVYSGGIVWLELEPPPGAEEFAGYEDTGCGRLSDTGSVSFISDPDDPDSPLDTHADRIKTVDYCSQETISDEVYAS